MVSRFKNKIWKKEDLDKAEKILDKAEKNKSKMAKHVEISLFLFTFLLGILATASVSVVSMPILAVGSLSFGAFMALVFGVLVGCLIIFFSWNMHWLGEHHHAAIALGVIFSGIACFALVAMKANEINVSRGILSLHEPLFLGFVYMIGFLAPYALFTIIEHLRRNSK